MKHVLLFVALFFAAHPALGQANTDPAPDTNSQVQYEYQPAVQQPHDLPPQERYPVRRAPVPTGDQAQAPKAPGYGPWNYDPAVKPGEGKRRLTNESVIERAAKGINPCNVPYGGLLAEWRLAAVQETIENVYYWGILFLIIALIISMSFNVWHIRRQDNRERIAGNIIAQLWNLHIFTRSRALAAIAAHNKLVAEIDAADAATGAAPPQSPASSAISATGPEVVPRHSSPNDTPQANQIATGEELINSSFEVKSTPMLAGSPAADRNGNENDAVPLSLRAAQWQEARREQPSAKAPEPGAVDGVDGSPVVNQTSEKNASTSGVDDMDGIKRELQQVKESLAAQAAQIATKDAQLLAKDAKITSQRQLVLELNNKLKAIGPAGSSAE
jgi:hypothetical protein